MNFLFLALVFLLLWATFDFIYGRKIHLNNLKPRSFPVRHSNFKLYTYGEALYKELFTDIQHAKHHIHILFFIL